MTKKCLSKTKHNYRLNYILAAFLSVFTFVASGNESEQKQSILTIQPQKCVAMREGQTCFINLEINWTLEATGNYCLYASNQNEPLRCWYDARSGIFKTEFSNNKNTVFYLKNEQNELAQVELKMAWVYKRKRSSVSWRVF